MLVPFHPSVAHALTAVSAVMLTMSQSPNLILSGVIYCINITHRQNSVVSEPTRQSECVCTEGVGYMAVNSGVGRESSSQHSPRSWDWPDVDSFLTTAVYVGGKHGEYE